jgi:Protein of unknown function DUF262
MQTFDITRTTYKVSDFVSWQRAKSLVLSPSFQRRPVWKPDAKSFLIDTVVRGLPMPVIFLREQSSDLAALEPRREVVDGQQRIRTLLSYISPRLLKDYEPARDDFRVKKIHNPDLAGKTFDELPPKFQRRILDYQFSVHVLPAGVDDREILQIFARMNATGVKLNDQELRNAEYFGFFKTLMYDLGSEQLTRWRQWSVFTEYNIARMEEVELTSEFASMMLRGLTKKTQSSLDSIYREKDEEFQEKSEVEKRFRAVMDQIDDNFGSDIVLLPFRQKTLFYSLFTAVYEVMFGVGSALKQIKPNAISSSLVTWIKKAGDKIVDRSAPEDVLDATGRRTTDLASRRIILKYLTKGH